MSQNDYQPKGAKIHRPLDKYFPDDRIGPANKSTGGTIDPAKHDRAAMGKQAPQHIKDGL